MKRSPQNSQIGLIVVLTVGCALVVDLLRRPGEVRSKQNITVAAEQVGEYVGKEVCRECHEKNFEFHSAHGHASTFATVAESDLPTGLDGAEFDGGSEFGTYRYRRNELGELIATLDGETESSDLPLQYVLGSGMHAKTFLTIIPSHRGTPRAVEHRATLYRDGELGMTPGQAASIPESDLEQFGDVHSGLPLRRCVYCHVTTGEIKGEEVVDLTPGVNCEKCHGPGGDHVRQARANQKPLPPFSVGRSDWDAEAEIQLCGDCHRMPRDINEREVRDYPDVLVRFQPIGMLRSRCYLDSEVELRCSSCHNPHRSSKFESRAEHEQKCVSCHSTEKPAHVACPVSSETGCVDCHMPSIEVTDGLSFHDHWIRVRE
ncbi:MAG: multiheme c-type cytochrome [Planctomycetota bacterium]